MAPSTALPGAGAHTAQAVAVSRATGWDLDAYAQAHEWSAVGLGPVGQSRDSRAYDRSNMRAAVAILDAAGARYAVASFGHWAVGWVEEIAHDCGDPATVAAVADIADRLSRYPLLDEDDAYAEEWAENHPQGTRIGAYCYAERSEECHYTDTAGRIVNGRDDRGRFVGTRP